MTSVDGGPPSVGGSASDGACHGLPAGSTPQRHERLEVLVRSMDVGDVDEVVAIESHSFSDPWQASAFVTLLQRRYALLRVAVDGPGKLVGYCVQLVVADEREIANICVDERVRGMGVAGQLLDDALAAADMADVAAVYLEVRESNSAARRLYDGRGFRKVGRRRGYYQHPVEDALVLRRGPRGEGEPRAGSTDADGFLC